MGVSTKVQIWDTAGSAAFRAASASFIDGSDAVIVCYDVSNRETFDGMRDRLDEVLLHRRRRRENRERQLNLGGDAGQGRSSSGKRRTGGEASWGK